jgi:putative spermidine/putrescine transport system substrate-binding protein
MEFCMRRLLAGLIPLTASLLVASASARAEEITVMAWGTTWEQGLQKVADNFTKATGIKVNTLPQASSTEGLVKLQSMKAKPTIDVWFTTSSVAARAEKDTELFAPIPKDKLTNADKLISGAETPSWVAAYYYPLSIVYRTDLVKRPITSWNDLWDPEFKGKVAVPTVVMYQARMLLIAALLNGGSLQNVEPGFVALKKLAPNVAMYYESDSDARKALAQGEASILVAPPVQAKSVSDDGLPVKIASPKPTPVMFDVMMEVNTPNKDAATKFIDFVVSPESQAILAKEQNCGPVNTAAQVPDDIKAAMPSAEDQVSFDEGVINANVSAWNDRFTKEIAH